MFNHFSIILMLAFQFLNSDLLEDLRNMYKNDQEARFHLIQSKNLTPEEIEEQLNKIDSENLPHLKAIIEQYGWPGYHLVGEEGVNKIWLLVQHADSDLPFQKLCLELLREAVAKNDAPKSHLAYLTDRVLVNEGKPQIYGTQILITDGQAHPQPVEDPELLDQRRAEMGLSSMADYLTQIKTTYGLQ